MIYLQLFWSFLKVGVFGFGGGYAMLSLIQNEVVENRNWISAQEFTDIVAISQMTPGPVAINSATYIGYNVSGSALGSALATLAVCLPPLVIMITITKFYLAFQNNKYVGWVMDGLKPMLIGMIGVAAFMLMTPSNFPDVFSVILFIAALAVSLLKVNPILIIIGGAVIGLIFL
ncbi:MAG: chromate transporter [Rikenellaceae bacterium]|nr:chromate transporter [Rikenellaceae bacterium]